jgi:type I restriction enzyme, S subunit
MSFPKYKKYKDSGVEWLGEVPEHWQMLPLRWFATCRSGESTSCDPMDTDDESKSIPVIGGNGVMGKTDKSNVNSTVLAVGRVGALCGNVHVVEPPAWITDNALVLDAKLEAFASIYLAELLRIRNLNDIASTTAQPLITGTQVRDQRLPAPPLEEQTAIADFLDAETSKIDALVGQQRRLIELLKEKRQAVISHAVTRGLNPTAPLKPSGIPWLGDVPEHWEVKRLKHISPFIAVGIVVNPTNYVSDDGLPFIYGGDIREGVIDWVNSRRIQPSASEANEKTLLEAGDVLTVRVGAPGVTAVVPKECEGGNCASVMLMRKGEYNSHWLCYAMNTRVVRHQVEVVQYGAAQKQFNIAHAVNFWVPVPGRDEQDAIVDLLKEKNSGFDQLITEATRAIELLGERRTALISAAVTGKIDVQDFTYQETI